METLRIDCSSCAVAGHDPEDCLVAVLADPPAGPTLTIAERDAMEIFEALGMLGPDEPQVLSRTGTRL